MNSVCRQWSGCCSYGFTGLWSSWSGQIWQSRKLPLRPVFQTPCIFRVSSASLQAVLPAITVWKIMGNVRRFSGILHLPKINDCRIRNLITVQEIKSLRRHVRHSVQSYSTQWKHHLQYTPMPAGEIFECWKLKPSCQEQQIVCSQRQEGFSTQKKTSAENISVNARTAIDPEQCRFSFR